MNSSKKHVVFIESNYSTGLLAIQKTRQTLNYQITFITVNRSCYSQKNCGEAAEYLLLADRVIEITDLDASLLKTVAELNQENYIDAILTFSDEHVLAAAKAAESIGRIHLNSLTALKARNKDQTRKKLLAASVSQPKFQVVSSFETALSYAQLIGYPLIAKPICGTASINVKLINNESELKAHALILLSENGYGRGASVEKCFLMEEYLSGNLLSVESVTTALGTHLILGITDRILGKLPYFTELGGSFPVKHHKAVEIIKTVKNALDAIGYNFGPAHTELIYTPEGAQIIEINPRLVGGVVPDMISAVYGYDILLEIVKMHCGETFNPSKNGSELPLANGVATIRAFYSNTSGFLKSIVASPLKEDSRVLKYQVNCQKGDYLSAVKSNRDRLGFLVVWEKNESESKRLADQLWTETHFLLEN